MKAIVFAETGGPEVLTLADAPQPAARPGSVLIKNHAIGVNFADTRFRQGIYTVKPRLPDIPGMEVAGVVEAVGEGVTNVRPGMRVAAFTSRAYAEYCVSPAFMVIPLPDSVSFVDGAAFLIQVLTAYHLLHTVDSTGSGRSVLVHSAAGGVGLAAVQLARAASHSHSARKCFLRYNPYLPSLLNYCPARIVHLRRNPRLMHLKIQPLQALHSRHKFGFGNSHRLGFRDVRKVLTTTD